MLRRPSSRHGSWRCASCTRGWTLRTSASFPTSGPRRGGISPSVFETFRAKGVSEELLDEIAARWDDLGTRQFEAHEEIGNFIALAHSTAPATTRSTSPSSPSGSTDIRIREAWAEILPDVVHVHAKFFDIEDDGREPVVPIEELLDVLVEGGYEGYISSEYEGWHWNTRERRLRAGGAPANALPGRVGEARGCSDGGRAGVARLAAGQRLRLRVASSSSDDLIAWRARRARRSSASGCRRSPSG